MPAYAYGVLIAAIAAWFIPFVLAHRGVKSASTIDKRSRWGVLLQLMGYSLLWQGHFWTRQLAPWRLAVCSALFGLAILLSWTSSSALGGHLRVDAALGAEHQLIRSGPYGLVRNPIYTSMGLVLCATGVVVAPWQLFAAGLALFMIGTEIRVRTEETLLAARFGDEFQQYKKSVAAYIPFVY
jgi:protein-S-isoprenylcysteine O-methyltransferase Ste14